MTTLSITTTGMKCWACPKLIEKRLERLSGVQAVNSDYEKGTTVVTFDAEWVSMVDVIDEIEEAGFGAPRITQ